MAVAFDAIGTNVASGSNVTSFSGTPITVGIGATLLLVGIQLNSENGSDATAPTGVAVTWNAVPMTQIASAANQSWGPAVHASIVYLFGLVNPAPGTLTVAASWTNISAGYISSISFSGTATSSVAAACPNVQTLTTQTFGVTGANAWNWTLNCVPGDFAVAYGCDSRGDFSGQTPGSGTAQWDTGATGPAVNAKEWSIYSTSGATGTIITLNDSVTNNVADTWSGIATNITGPLFALGGIGGHFARRVNVVEY
jgi:hypothetical protein